MGKHFFRIVITILCFAFWINHSFAQEDKRYVRKAVQPNFFIPNGDLAQNRQEKVIMPRYGKGQSTAKRISINEDEAPTPSLIYKPKANTTSTTDLNSSDEYAPEATSLPERQLTKTSVPQNDETPNYQQMYQNYLKDLESIAKTGNVTNDTPLNDLNEMNSETRINIDRKFNEKRNIDQEIENAIKK